MSGKGKRTRKSPSKRGGGGTSSKRGRTTTSANSAPFWTRLLQEIETCCSSTLQLTDKHPLCQVLLADDGANTTTSKKEHEPIPRDASYYFILSTCAVQELLPLTRVDDAYAAIAVCGAWTTSSTSPLHRRWSTSSSRLLVGRSCVTFTAACTQALRIVVRDTTANQTKRSVAIVTAVLALDALTHQGSLSHPTDWSTGTQVSWMAYVQQHRNDTDPPVPSTAIDWSPYEACLDDTAALEQLPKIPRMDVRLALKRWTAVFLTWYGGQKLLLEAALAILDDTSLDFDGVHRVFCLESNKKDAKRKGGVKAVSVAVPSDVTRLAIVGRLVHSVADVDSGAGSRPPPPEGWATHMQQLLGTNATTIERSNVQNVSIRVLHHLLDLHATTLDGRWVEFSQAPTNCRLRKVPDEYKVVSSQQQPFFEHVVSYYPYVLHTVQCLLLVNHSDRLDALAAAWMFGPARTDATLAQHATEALGTAWQGRSSSSTSTTQLLLDTPLTLPKEPRKTQRKAAAASSSKSSATDTLLAHLLPATPLFGADDRLALLLRATTPDRMIDVLLDQLEACYDTRRHGIDVSTTSESSGKRKADTTPATQKRQRNSTNRASKVAATATATSEETTKFGYVGQVCAWLDGSLTLSIASPLAALRNTLACRTVRVLLLVLRSETTTTFSPVQQTLRQRFTLDHLYRIVDLGNVLYPVVQVALATVDGVISKSVLEAVRSDKHIWIWHRELQTAIFSGPMPTDRNGGILERTEVLALLLERAARNGTRHKEGWPICTTAAQQSLIASGLTVHKDTTTPDIDTRMVNGFVKEVTWLLEKTQNLTSVVNTLDPQETLLSLHDARFFCHAFLRLPGGAQDKALLSLLNPMHKLVTKTKPETLDRLFWHHGVAPFFARLLTLCSNLVAILRYNRQARRLLILSSRKVLSNDGREQEAQFLSLFDPTTPTVPVMTSSPRRAMAKTIITKLQEVMDGCLGIGFKTIVSDECHLMFSAWNALGLSSIWCDVKTTINTDLDDLLQGPLTEILSELRNDVCLLHLKAKRTQESLSPSNLVATVCCEKLAGSSPLLATDYQLLVRKCTKIIEQLLARFVPEDEGMTQDIPTPLFSVLKLCASAISFGIASMTKPNVDAIAQMQREFGDTARKRAYSSESEGGNSDEGSVSLNESLLQVLDRFVEVSGEMGGVPCHPDWLDSSCTLLPGLSLNDTLLTVREAQAALTNLLLLSHKQSCKSRERAMQTLEPEAPPDRQRLALLLCTLCSYDTPVTSCCGDTNYNDRDFASDIATVCGIKASSVLPAPELSDEVCESFSKAERTWSGPSGLRVTGRFDSILKGQNRREIVAPELRAAGEWEALLSHALLTPVDFDSEQSDLVGKAERWDEVRGACWEGLIPVAALAHFCYANGNRGAHPLRSLETSVEDLEDLISDYFDDDRTCIDKSLVPGCVQTLAAIARIPTCGNHNAIAMHLMMEPRTFELLYGTDACSLSLQAIALLAQCFDGSKKTVDAARALLRRPLWIIELHGAEVGRSLDMDPFDKPFKLLAACGVEILQVVPLCDDSVTPVEAFRRIGHDLCILSDESEDARTPSHTQYIGSLFKLSCHKKLGTDTDTDASNFLKKVTSALGLLAMELGDKCVPMNSTDLLDPAVDVLTRLPDDKLVDLVRGRVCATSTKRGDLSGLGYLCKLFAILAASGSMKASGHTSQVIYATLAESFGEWKTYESGYRRCLLALTVLYATLSDNVGEFGSTLLGDLRDATACPENVVVCENMKDFMNFLCLVRDFAGKQTTTTQPQEPRNHPKLPPKCTYAGEELFLDQHWYNCLTCGLVDDKGCCSLCAVRCHAGHAVEYARYSPFFCDCGSHTDEKEDSEEGGESRKCECLADGARDAFFREISAQANYDEETGLNIQSGHLLLAESAEIVAKFTKSSEKLASTLSDTDRSGLWIRTLVDCTGQWLEQYTSLSTQKTSSTVEEMILVRQQLLNGIEGKRQLGASSSLSYTSLGATETGTIVFNLQNCSDADQTTRSLTAMESRGTFTSIIDADVQGRVVVAEKGCLTFFAAFSLVGQSDWFSVFKRKDLSLLCSVPVGIDAIGVKFCPYACAIDERSILIWNEDSAKVVSMRGGCATMSRILRLGVKLMNKDGDGEDGVIRCEWLNAGLVLVGCRRSLQVFCIDEGNTSHCEYRLSVPHRLRKFAVTHADVGGPSISFRLYLVSTEGRLRSCEIQTQDDGTFIVGGWEQHDDLLRKLCGFAGTDAELECTTLAYLPQSRSLVCYMLDRGTILLCLDRAGKVQGGFELVKNKLPAQVSTKGPIVGPFRHWRELGMVHYKSQTYFSVCCVGSHDVSKKAALLVLLFNGTETVIQLVSILPKVVGLATVSMPIQNSSAVFSEHNAVFAVGENGVVNLFKESCGTKIVPQVLVTDVDDDNGQTQRYSFNPDFEVLAFEELKNITHSPRLVMSADGIDSSTLKQNLLPENELYATSPRAEGFSMTVSLLSASDQEHVMLEPEQNRGSNELVISALRVLFGVSSTCRTPRSFKVMGRTIDVSSGSRGWYSVILTRQEVAFSVRFGFVTVEFKESHDSVRGPVVDAIEVYAKPRNSIEQWLPFSTSPWTPTNETTNTNDADPDRVGFELTLASLVKLKSVCGTTKSTKAEKLLVKQVIQETAFSKFTETGELVNQLLDGFEIDDAARSLFQDKSLLAACSSNLKRCDRLLCDVKGTDREASIAFSVTPTLRSCLKIASSIARARPFNYLQVADETSGSSGSIASDASSIVIRHILTGFAIPSLIEDLVGLMLLEIAVTNGSPRGRFGSLDGLRQLLLCQHHIVVEFVCKAISRFCSLQSIFEAQPMALGYVCDYCLRVIDEERFSSGEGNFDLCLECYNHGKAFCDSSKKRENDFVVIKGRTVGETPKLTCGELMRMVLTGNDSATEQRSNQLSSQSSRMVFNAFMDGLTHGLTSILVDKIHTMHSIPSALVLVCIDLFQHSVQAKNDTTEAKKILASLARSLSNRIEESLAWNVGLREDSVLILEGIAALAFPSRTQREVICGLREDIVCTENEDHGVCCTHGTPAVVKYAKTGWDAEKQFYTCCHKSPCRFFRWKDTTDPHEVSAGEQLRSSTEVGSIVWGSLSKPGALGASSIADRLCEVVKELLNSLSLDVVADEERKIEDLPSNALATVLSGALCNVSRLGSELAFNNIGSQLHKAKKGHIVRSGVTDEKTIIDFAFQLVALVGSADLQQFRKWLPVLSELVISKSFQTSQLKRTQHLARQVLVQFCGIDGSQETVDYFGHAGHIRDLSLVAKELMDYCRIVNEKAKRSREIWDGEPLVFSRLSMANLMGVHLLINEDVSSMSTCTRANTVFSEMTAFINKDSSTDSWRRFCGMRCVSHILQGVGMDVAPLKLLFAMACAASTANQTWALRLIYASLKFDPKPITDVHYQAVVKFLYPDGSSPENVFGLSVDDGVLFAVRFVLRGHTSEARGLGSNILIKLFPHKADKSAVESLVRALFQGPLHAVGSMGKRSLDFFNLLKYLVDNRGREVVPVAIIARSLQVCIAEQFLAIRHDRQNGEFMWLETKSAASIQKKRYEFSRCASCRIHTSKYKPKGGKTSTTTGIGTGTARKSALSEIISTAEKVRSPPEQVTPQARGKFGLAKENSCSSEFAAYFSLRYRIALYSVHLEIENARKQVKTINVYFTSRPVQEASTLKSPEYSIKWQLCGTFDLSRGCSRASLELELPVVAANIKIEYSDFHDRPGVSKSSDGKTIACPRCSGDVNVAHGVCTSCGEAAFQCRKCRHINYDRLDAFLCVECGFCASASFQFEMTAGMATNAVAITNDEELAQSQRMLQVASRCYNDYKCAVKQKLSLVAKKKPPRSTPGEIIEGAVGSIAGGTPAIIQKAFHDDEAISYHNGEKMDFTKLTLSQIGKPGSVLKLVARPERMGDQSPVLGVPRRARSSRRPEGILIRGLGADGEEESASELLSSLLESGGLSRYASGLDNGDPLSRLLASVSSRQIRTTSDEQPEQQQQQQHLPEEGEEQNISNDKSKKKDRKSNGNNNTKDALELCDRLYTLMMEAEREVFELERRIEAWKSLTAGQLGAMSFPSKFCPSHCSQCSTTIALQLLLLWLKVFALDPDAVEITEEFVSMLLRDDCVGHNVKETRRLVVKEIALRSKQGQALVLEALRNRLLLLQDMTSAEILRKILEEVEQGKPNPFVDLAKEVLTKGVDGHCYRF